MPDVGTTAAAEDRARRQRRSKWLMGVGEEREIARVVSV
jgi:hypothetical protein